MMNPRINNKLKMPSNLRNHSNNVIQAAELNWIELTALTRSLQNKNQKKNWGSQIQGHFATKSAPVISLLEISLQRKELLL